VGKPYDAEAVVASLDQLFATGLFEGVWPRVFTGPDSAAVLHLRLEAPPVLSLAVGGAYDNDRGGRAWAALDRYGRLGLRPAVFSAAASIGGLDQWGTLSLRAYSHPSPTLIWTLGGQLQERAARFFLPDARGTQEVVRAGGWLSVELPHILREQLIAAAMRVEAIDVENGRSGISYGPMLRFTSFLPEARVAGVPLVVEAERRWGEQSYTRLLFSGSADAKVGKTLFAAILDLRGVSAAAPPDVKPALGDDHMIPGLRWGEFRGRARAVVGADAAYPIGSAFVRLRARVGAVSDQLEWDSFTGTTGGQIGLFWATPIGILEAGYGLATRGDGRFDVALGRRF
jgi:hypothetical protein